MHWGASRFHAAGGLCHAVWTERVVTSGWCRCEREPWLIAGWEGAISWEIESRLGPIVYFVKGICDARNYNVSFFSTPITVLSIHAVTPCFKWHSWSLSAISKAKVKFSLCLINHQGWCSRYSDALRTWQPWFDSQQMQEIFLLSTEFRPTVGSTESPTHWLSGAFSLGAKWAGRETHHSPSNAEVKNGGATPPLS
jgi:hypothetical protein